MDIILLGIKNTPIIIKEMEFIHIYVILKKIWKRKKLFTYKKILIHPHIEQLTS